MKTIQMTDEDYDKLMELSKELQLQDNNGQAFPYFWEPSSYRMEMNPHGEGQDVRVYRDTELYGFLEFAEYDEFENYNKFLEHKMEYDFDPEDDESEDNVKYALGEYYQDLEEEWKDYIDDYIDDTEIYTFDWNQKQDHNPTLFKSDAENHLKINGHNIEGKDLHTYSRTIYRMPKMYDLVQILMRVNPQPKETVNHEALRFTYPEVKK